MLLNKDANTEPRITSEWKTKCLSYRRVQEIENVFENLIKPESVHIEYLNKYGTHFTVCLHCQMTLSVLHSALGFSTYSTKHVSLSSTSDIIWWNFLQGLGASCRSWGERHNPNLISSYHCLCELFTFTRKHNWNEENHEEISQPEPGDKRMETKNKQDRKEGTKENAATWDQKTAGRKKRKTRQDGMEKR